MSLSLHRLPLGAVRPRGWIRAQLSRDLERGFAGCLDGLSPHVARDLFAERLAEGEGGAAWWDAESRGNWLWGYTWLAHLCGAEGHTQRADALVAALRATQEADGYLGIHPPAMRYRSGDTENGELWAQSRALLVLLAHHELTGNAASLDSARRAADLTLACLEAGYQPFGSRPTLHDRTGVTHGLCYVDALWQLNEITGDDRYRSAVGQLLAAFDAWPVPFPNDDLAAANLAAGHRSLQGHAVHTAEHLRAVVAGAPHDAARHAAALCKLRGSTTPSGALIGDESLHGLPGPWAAYEYCTLVELAASLARVAQHAADPALGDWLERLVFNAAQGARDADGRALGYLCSDTRTDARVDRPDSYSALSGRHGRFKLSPTHDDVACCCNPNSTRLMPGYLAAMWMRAADAGLLALAYGPSILTTAVGSVGVCITQDTAYPFEDRVRVTVEVDAPLRFALHLRRPAWVRAVVVTGVEHREQDGFLVVERDWSGSTTFELRFDVPVALEPYPYDEFAVMRGPLQFVQPLAHRRRPLPHDRGADWPDAELLSGVQDLAAARPIIDATATDAGFALERVTGIDALDPWSAVPLRLHGNGVRLVPMGCAPLRIAGFLARGGLLQIGPD